MRLGRYPFAYPYRVSTIIRQHIQCYLRATFVGAAVLGKSAEKLDGDSVAGTSGLDPRWQRLLTGVILALGAPTGWLLYRLATGASLYRELVTQLALYTYLTVSTAVAFGLFGYLLGKREQRLRKLAERFAEASITDALTGLINAQQFHSRLGEALERHRRSGENLSLIIMDLDRFKMVNDSWGHPTGDKVISAVGDLLRANLRPYDTAGRVGGEEFGIVLPHTDSAEASLVAERLRQKLANRRFYPVNNSEEFTVTASFGIASVPSEEEITRTQFYARADKALYSAKEAGRNRIDIATGLEAFAVA